MGRFSALGEMEVIVWKNVYIAGMSLFISKAEVGSISGMMEMCALFG